MAPNRLRWAHYAEKTQGPYHVARVRMAAGYRGELHTHDFAEVFLVERGHAAHVVNGERQGLTRGDLVFIRPDDVHVFEALEGGITFVNVAMSMATLRTIESRYFETRGEVWPWRKDGQPVRWRLPLRQLERASEWAGRLAGAAPTVLLLDAFLLDLVSLEDAALIQELPVWLAEAVARFTTTEEFAGGAGRLAALTGRTPEHVNRVVRRLTGRSTTEYINDLRVAHAARQLRLTDRSIADIAFGCGIHHLTYFYRIFGQRMGVAPSRYRRRQRMGMD